MLYRMEMVISVQQNCVMSWQIWGEAYRRGSGWDDPGGRYWWWRPGQLWRYFHILMSLVHCGIFICKWMFCLIKRQTCSIIVKSVCEDWHVDLIHFISPPQSLSRWWQQSKNWKPKGAQQTKQWAALSLSTFNKHSQPNLLLLSI